MCVAEKTLLSRLREVVPKIIFVKCTCHSLALCCEYAFKKLPSNLEYLISEIARWFKLSSLRREEFKEVFSVMNDECIQPSKFITPSNTRWLVKGKCIFNIITQWHELKAYFSVIAEKERNYHARLIHQMISDERNYLYLTFALPHIQNFESVNASFQATDAELFKVFSELKQLHSSILKSVYKDDGKNVAYPLSQVKYGDKFLLEISRSKLPEEEKSLLKQRCFDFLIEAESQLEKRLSRDTNVVENLRYLQPKMCLNQMCKTFSIVAGAFTHLICSTSKVINMQLEQQYDKLLLTDWRKEFPNEEIPHEAVNFWTVVRKYENAAGEKCFAELAQIVLNAHALPLSNAYVERIFSHVTNIKTKVRNRLSLETLEAILRIRSHLCSEGICCNKFKVTDKMLSMFNSSIYKSSTEVHPEEPSTSSAATSRDLAEQDSQDFDEMLQVHF